MKELINNVTITGELVKIDFDEFTSKKTGDDMFGGSLILRTSDKSEHEVRFVTGKYKKDEKKRITSEENYFYKQYLSAKENLKDIEHCEVEQTPDIISITDGSFNDNDFKSKNGDIVSSNTINARFIKKIEPKDYDSTILEAKFEVEGIIDSIVDEIVKNNPTGNLVVKFLAFNQMQKDYKDSNTYDIDHLVPVKLIVDKSMATDFRQAGYYDGGYAKFVGSIVNTVEIQTVIEKAAFGKDIENEVKTYVRKNEIKSGTAVSTIFEHELTQEIVDALKAKRKAKLAEIASGKSKAGVDLPFTPDTSTPAPQTTYNPFAQQ